MGPPLPSGYKNIENILGGDVPIGSLINVCGVVKDQRLPRETGGREHKSTLALVDLSVEDDMFGLDMNIFRPLSSMPQVSCGDIVVVKQAKVQKYLNNPVSLITNIATSIRVYSASKIPKWPNPADCALTPATGTDKHVPKPEENVYVSYLHAKFNKYALPTEEEFRRKQEQSMNFKSKFSLLQDVTEGQFCDLIVQVARDPHHDFEKSTIYVSDYTENPNFYPRVWQDSPDPASMGGDPYGYTAGDGPEVATKEWVGPYGKMSIQVTCYEPHAFVVREEVRAGTWVKLRNVQIKYGNNGQNLEGFMRGEQNASTGRVNVDVFEMDAQDPETVDPKLKEALRRCRDYQQKKKQQIKEIQAAKQAGQKRRSLGVSSEKEERPPNKKERRKNRPQAAKGREDDKRLPGEALPDLNALVSCENHDVPPATIENILKPHTCETIIDGKTVNIPLPFVCANYQTRVRVVDFFPRSLEQFACSRKVNEYAILSDNEDDSDSGSDESASSSDYDGSDGGGGSRRTWAWRFALQLEDASPPDSSAGPPPRLWALVDDLEGQCLVGMGAGDLRRKPRLLDQLRETLFTLWGNLEEVKSQQAATAEKVQTSNRARQQQCLGGRLPKPPLDSSLPPNTPVMPRIEAEVSNKPFTCCLRQYGVQENEEGEGEDTEREWIRCFGLFGTRIIR
ncbi:uncharacterized protein C8A04DRAFT_13480 [Dichotomopilus funicola]|uniref:Protection of telomeres protein 1 n=1 Tax=Dichotomopilus funicola TaxID=1934379 RepID=A0AAN6ZK24_9PEZI|nr:hypothetical protein C8A04DRAFT_13480 [Dichotomopilus funicola]